MIIRLSFSFKKQRNNADKETPVIIKLRTICKTLLIKQTMYYQSSNSTKRFLSFETAYS